MMSDLATQETPDSPSQVVALDLETPSPLNLILMTSGGYCVSRALHAIADLGIADSIGDSPAAIAEVASDRRLDADALARMLRLLSAHGIFSTSGGLVSHNDSSRLLRSDHPQSARALARMFGMPVFWDSFQSLTHSISTGRPAVEAAFPEGFWGWLRNHPDSGAIFDEAMTGKSHAQVASVMEAYDFSSFNSVADIGGGRGHLLQAILNKHSNVRGVLFEQHHVVDELSALGSERLVLVGGDFFENELPSSDAYVLMEVIHDWDDADSLRILSAVFDAAPSGATLLLVEQLMPEKAGAHWVRMLDIHMLALFGAKQRSQAEYAQLLSAAGFQLRTIIDTFSGATIIEALKP